MSQEISHYEIKSFKNAKAGFLYFDTQSSWKNNKLTQIGRRIIKLTTGRNIEHIALIVEVPNEFINAQYIDEYNGRDFIERGYVVFEATKNFNSIATNIVKRIARPSLNDIDNKGDSKWSGDVYFQEINPTLITDETRLLAFQSMLNLTNQKPWFNGNHCVYKLIVAILSPFPFAKYINKLIGYKKLTPSVFCSVQAKYGADILTGQLKTPEEFNMLESLGVNPKDLSMKYEARGFTKIPKLIVRFVDGDAVSINHQHINGHIIYK